MTFLLILLTGSGLTFQAAINSRLREYAGGAVLATLIQFTIGLILLLALAFGSNAFSGAARLKTAPLWVFLGGALGVAYVSSAMIAVPRIGSSMLLITAVTGQMLASLAIDHNGWFGVAPVPMSAKRVAGAVLLAAALWCLKRQ